MYTPVMADPAITLAILACATLLATIIQTLAGFGFALIMMPIVTLFLELRIAAPLVALTALTLYLWNTVRYRAALNVREIWPLGCAAVAGVPVGIWAVGRASEPVVKGLLGLLLIAYAVQGLLGRGERRCSAAWAPAAGFLAGCLGGAYNTSGPPLAVYGALRGWDKAEFRAGIQTLFLCSGVVTVLSHAVARHLTPPVLLGYAATPPLLATGLLIGGRIDRYVDKERFRTLVMAMILFLGIMLALQLARH